MYVCVYPRVHVIFLAYKKEAALVVLIITGRKKEQQYMRLTKSISKGYHGSIFEKKPASQKGGNLPRSIAVMPLSLIIGLHMKR